MNKSQLPLYHTQSQFSEILGLVNKSCLTPLFTRVAHCQTTSNLHIWNSFEKLRSFYTKLILIIFFYSGSKGSRNSPKVLHYPKEKWVLQVYFYFPIRCMHLTLNRNIPIMPISLFWDNAKMCKTLDQFRDPLNMV